MALKLTVTPSTQYIEDSINIKITGGSIPSNYILQIGAWDKKTGDKSGLSLFSDQTNLSSNMNIIADSDHLFNVYHYPIWQNTSQVYVLFELLKPIGSQSYETVSEVWKTMYIKPEPPTFYTTPTYEDINIESLALTNNNQMIVNGLSTIRISNLVGTAYKGGTPKTIKINDVTINYDYDTIINGTGYIDIELDNIKLNKELVVTLIDSRGWNITETIADISKFKYLWLNPKINKLEAEHNGVSETTPLTASGLYSEGYQLGTTTFGASYSYKENVESSSEVSGLSTLNISKNSTNDYDNFIAILNEYNNPTYTELSTPIGTPSFQIWQYYDEQTWQNGINDLFSIALQYNDKYTEEYLTSDHNTAAQYQPSSIYVCVSGGYNGWWKQFWKDTLEAIYDKIYEDGGNYEFNVENPALIGDVQSGFSIDKTFFIKLLVENTISGSSKNAQSQVLLPTAVPAIDVYKSNVSIHGLYDETLGGTQIEGDLLADFVTEINNDGTWYWRKWHSGWVELYAYHQYSSLTLTSSSAGTYYGTAQVIDLPFRLTEFFYAGVQEVSTRSSGVYVYDISLTTNNTKLSTQFRAHATTSNGLCGVKFYITGKYK